MVVFTPRSTEIFTSADPRAGGLTHSVSLSDYQPATRDPAGVWARYDAARTVETYIANNIASIPFDLYSRAADGSRERVADDGHPVAAMLEEPTKRIGFARWAQGVMLDWRIHDRWACLRVTNPDGTLELLRLPAQRVSFLLDPLRRITHASVKVGTQSHDIPIAEVVFDVGYDPFARSKTSGYPLSNTMEASATELEKGAKYRDDVLSGGPRVPMYIFRPANTQWGSGGKEAFKASFSEYSNVRAGQSPLLEDGMELRAVPSLTSADISYKEMRLAAQIEYCIANLVPPELLGYRTGTFSNIEALKEQLYTNVLQFDIIAFRQALNTGLRDLLPAGWYIEENVAARLAASPEKQAESFQKQVGSPVLTVNEARRMMNKPPVPGGDDIVVPLNVTRGGLASPADTGPKARPMVIHESKASVREIRDEFSNRVDEFARRMKGFFGEQRERVLTLLGDASSPGALADAFDGDIENAALADLIYRASFPFAEAGAKSVVSDFGAPGDGFDPELMLPWLQKASINTAAAINDSTFGKLASAVFGETWQEDARSVFDDRISRSTNYAAGAAQTSKSFGQYDAAKSQGVPFKKWVTSAKDSRHASLNGEIVPVGETFSNGSRYPGDPKLDADERIGCACEMVFVKEQP